jgi:hypothetical protein
MTRELADVLIQCLQADDVECELYENYSGRGMMGSATTGIQGDVSLDKVLSSVIAHAELLVADGESMFCGEELRQDELGMDNIVY